MTIEFTREELKIIDDATHCYIFHTDVGASSQEEYEIAEIIRIKIKKLLNKS